MKAALERTVLFELTRRSDSEPSSPSGSASNHHLAPGSGPAAYTKGMLEAVDVDACKCYDPNEEAVLKRIIKTVGINFFNTRLRALAQGCRRVNFF